jgi:hypothetical protein
VFRPAVALLPVRIQLFFLLYCAKKESARETVLNDEHIDLVLFSARWFPAIVGAVVVDEEL